MIAHPTRPSGHKVFNAIRKYPILRANHFAFASTLLGEHTTCKYRFAPPLRTEFAATGR